MARSVNWTLQKTELVYRLVTDCRYELGGASPVSAVSANAEMHPKRWSNWLCTHSSMTTKKKKSPQNVRLTALHLLAFAFEIYKR